MQTYLYKQPPAPPTLPPMPYKVFFPLIMRTGESYGTPPPATLHQPFAVISTTAGFRATYDANGNMAVRVENGITYTQRWDVENRLAVVTNTATLSVTRFYYDGDGNRVKKADSTGTTYYVGQHYETSILSCKKRRKGR